MATIIIPLIFGMIKHRNFHCILNISLVSCLLPQNTRTPEQQMTINLNKSKKRLQNLIIIALTFGMIKHRSCHCILEILLVGYLPPQNTRSPEQQMPLKLGKSS